MQTLQSDQRNTDKMTVSSTDGSIITSDSLTVAGETQINDSLIVAAITKFLKLEMRPRQLSFKLIVITVIQLLSVQLTVNDATQINNTLGVSNVTTITRNTQQTLTGSYSADGAFRLTGGAVSVRTLLSVKD